MFYLLYRNKLLPLRNNTWYKKSCYASRMEISMNQYEFQQFISGKIRYLDGATGSNLMKAGMPSGVCPEQWILDHREVCIELQKAYVDSGTDILYCPTFTANRIKLEEYHLEKQQKEMIRELVSISAQAASGADHRVLLAGDLTMTGKQLVPIGEMTLEELIDIYKEQITCLEQAGVDLLVVETMMSLQETRAALIAAKECTHLPVMVTLTFEKDGRTLFGTDALTAAVCLEKLGASAIGANCSTGPAQMAPVIRAMAGAVSIPIIAKPNAGLPTTDEEGKTCYDMDAASFAQEMTLLVKEGASILGGCCGTDPSYIQQLKAVTKDLKPSQIERKSLCYLTSERQTVSFGLNQNFIIVGERINPTGKKALQAQLRNGEFDMVIRFAEEQEQLGAQILDINMGMNGINEKEMMLRAIHEVGCVTNLPLSLDSSHVDVLKDALRQYPGRALINSISMENAKMEKLLHLAVKYGAMFILLPLSDKGLPANMEEKKQIIHTIMDRALSLGMKKEDIIVDGLVTTIGANKMAAIETLETIRYCKELGLATICGLSNISFGMPDRSYVNTAFLTLAIQSGLTMAIANPSQELLVKCAMATDLLLNKEGALLRYVEHACVNADHSPQAKTGNEGSKTNLNVLTDPKKYEIVLHEAVMKGRRKEIAEITSNAIKDGAEPSALLNQILLPAINQVGEYFDKGKYFLPQLIASAEAMKNAIQILEPLLSDKTDKEQLPVVVMATVEGDIHDIGKNLVVMMLKNYGFTVIDLGKDVPASKIIDAAIKNKAAIIGLSALMTTTMLRMKEVVDLVKEKGLACKVVIGGAVITPEFAEEIQADGYANDAADAVKVVRMILQMKQ